MKIEWVPLALTDLGHACEFIRRDNPAAAERAGKQIETVIGRLARFPNMGFVGRRPGTRELIVPDLPFRVVYRVRGDAVQILRIYHLKRRWPV